MSRLRWVLCALSVVFFSALSGRANEFVNNSFGPPWGCAQWPLVELAEGIIYYADWYQTSCNDNPQACYVFGDYDYPQICPDCVPGNDDDFLSHRFPGLSKPIAEDYVLSLPEGAARENSEPSETPDLKFIQIEDTQGALITAKVFAFRIYPRRLSGESATDSGRTIVVAMQMEGEPDTQPVHLASKPLETKTPCYAYSTVYEPAEGQRFPILVLTAK